MNSGSNTKREIFKLRVLGKSYREIAGTLGVSRSTVSYWLADNKESQKIRAQLVRLSNSKDSARVKKLKATLAIKWGTWADAARQEAAKRFNKLLDDPLFVAGIMIYWGEGDSKIENPLRMGNTDPRMIGIFVKFLRVLMDIPVNKIRLGLILYPDLSDKECIEFWQTATGLPSENFIKSHYIKGLHPTKRLSHGICTVTVNSKQQKIKMLEWIDLFAKKNIISR